MRRAALLVGALWCVVSGAGSSRAAPPDYTKAYAMAMRCMIFSSTYKDETHARVAFDAWKRLGELQGLENARMNVDMDWAVSRETRKFHNDPRYRSQTQADCRALGWAQ